MIKKVLIALIMLVTVQSCGISGLGKMKGLSFESTDSTILEYADVGTIGASIPIYSPPKNLKIKKNELIIYIHSSSFIKGGKIVSFMISPLIPLPPIIPVFSDFKKESENKCKNGNINLSFNFSLTSSFDNKNRSEFSINRKEIYFLTKNNKKIFADTFYNNSQEVVSLFKRSGKEFDDSITLQLAANCSDLEDSKLFINGIYKNNERIEIEPINILYKEGYVLTFGWLQ
jgi:hypothetical protein